ncbi:MAG: hypothetical protein COS35_06580 [Zetaproteobacteria bacterium CG02_land_8_20_14_3_00_50_9]|mgnify:CR=1 FL=1|nr:MAG: hypothetical protein AUJ57_00125 [Zetaproteobacteria bacterium CG1_02_53_45]PIV30503.1 MAG: hypothetical protein COS35_06580 [Zetaproteobacteria bacterium CG02_land_8_20_14_3_00_50_9]PIY56789.1 MAG: hypothetical protein COZ00_02370 [Zetaproteobacteria bacterium CG_4_10_14_0_8_um_filter_49_80]
MNMISNPDGSISTSRLFNVVTWVCLLLKFMLPETFGELDPNLAQVLLLASNGTYAVRAFTQGKHGQADPRGNKKSYTDEGEA